MNRYPQEVFVIREAIFDGLYAIMMVNHALKNYPYRKEYPWNLQITIPIVENDGAGLPTQKEAEVLNRFEDRILHLLSRVCRLHFIGRTTWNNLRTLMVYVDNPEQAHEELQKLIGEVDVAQEQNEEGVRGFEYEMQEDEDWSLVDNYYDYSDGEMKSF